MTPAISRSLGERDAGGSPDVSFLVAFDALPLGTHKGRYAGRRYIFTKSEDLSGAAQHLAAEELGGSDYISFNLYRVSAGARLKPCEMPAAKVTDFVFGLKPD